MDDTIKETQNVEKPTDIPEELQKKLESSGVDIQKFESHLPSLSPEEKTKLFQLITSVRPMKLKLYVKKNGFIINSDTHDVFIVQFGKTEKEKSEERVKTKSEVDIEETEIDMKEAETLKNEEKIKQQFHQHIDMFK